MEDGSACLILFFFQCETRSVTCLKWLIGIFCLFFFFLFSFLKKGVSGGWGGGRWDEGDRKPGETPTLLPWAVNESLETSL